MLRALSGSLVIAVLLVGCAAPSTPSPAQAGGTANEQQPRALKAVTVAVTSTIEAMSIAGGTTTAGGWQSANELPPAAAQDPTPTSTPPAATDAGWEILASAPGQFEGPRAIAVDSEGNLYVAYVGNRRIQKLGPDGTPLAQWGGSGSGPGQFSSPKGVAVDGQGNVYVTDDGNHSVQKFSPAGEPLGQWGSAGSGPGQYTNPVGVAVDGAGNIYVADGGRPGGGRCQACSYIPGGIQQLSAAGEPLARWESEGEGEPKAIAVDSSGNVNVAYWTGPFALRKVTPAGEPLAEWASGSWASGVAVDSVGNLYVLYADHRIQKLSPDGTPLAQWGSQGSGPGQFRDPGGVAVDGAGNLYVADTRNNRIQKLPASAQR
jgi:sugar lactone lactonase YvrE